MNSMQQITSSMAVKGQAVHSGRMKIIIYYLFGIMFFFAISSTMIGILIPEMTTSYNLNNTQIGIIGSECGRDSGHDIWRRLIGSVS